MTPIRNPFDIRLSWPNTFATATMDEAVSTFLIVVSQAALRPIAAQLDIHTSAAIE